MSMVLPPELEARVNRQVAEGSFETPVDVLDEALRLLESAANQRKLSRLREDVRAGLESLEKEGSRPFDEAAVERILEVRRERAAAEGLREYPRASPEELAAILARTKPFDAAAWLRETPHATPEEVQDLDAWLEELRSMRDSDLARQEAILAAMNEDA
jgi:antitoxin ParD1/3/4